MKFENKQKVDTLCRNIEFWEKDLLIIKDAAIINLETLSGAQLPLGCQSHKENGTANHVKNIITARLNGSRITKKKEY